MSRQPLRGRDAYRVWRDITTRWADNDAYGHVNNVVYYSFFDTAVNHWLIGEGLLDIATGDPIGLVVETGCRYARPLTYPEPVEIGLAVESVGTSSVRYRLGIFAKGSAEPAAEGHFTHVYVARASRRPVALPAAWREKFEAILVAPEPAPAASVPAPSPRDERADGRPLRLRPNPFVDPDIR